MENVILSPIPLEQLTGLLTSIVRHEIRTKQEEDLQHKFLSPKETCKLFSPAISLVTLEAWSQKGLMNKHYISGRTYFIYSEVMEAVKKLKKYQRQPQLQDQTV